MTDAATWDRNAELLKGRLDLELRDVDAFLREESRRLFPGLMGKVLNPLAGALLAWIGQDEIKKRAHQQLAMVIGVAREIESAPLDEVWERNRQKLLTTEELYVRAQKTHPHFPALVEGLERLGKDRLYALHRFLSGARGDPFVKAVPPAFPERAELAGLLRGQIGGAWDITRLVERDPSLIKIPGLLQKPLFNVVHNSLRWYERRIEAFLNEAYGPAK